MLLVLPVLLLAGCGEKWVVTFEGGAGPLPDDALVRAVLTPDGDDAFEYESSGPVLRITAAPTNASGNLRNVFWPASAPSVIDGQSCATWTAQTEGRNVQHGAALRVRTDADGNVMQAVTVTKNIFFGVTWVFNVHVWDTALSEPRTGIAQVDMHPVVGGKPYPWHVCTRTVGTVLTMKVWTGDEPEPEWGVSPNGASVTLPPEWVYPGTTGWYLGHLPPGGFADFADLKTWKYEAAATPPVPTG